LPNPAVEQLAAENAAIAGLYQNRYAIRMIGRTLKPIVFLGDALDQLRAFPD
jgi:hypothetical protein